MATRVYVTPVGVDLKSIEGNGWQIAGIMVDNPSGSYLSVAGYSVPPYTMGWTIGLTPTALWVDVLFVNSPSGSQGQLVGGPIVVTLYDTPLPNFSGQPSGTAAQTPTTPRTQTYLYNLVNAQEAPGGPQVTFISPSESERIVILKIGAYMDVTGLTTSGRMPRTVCNLLWGFFSAGGGSVFARLSISPNSPSYEKEFAPGILVLDTDSLPTPVGAAVSAQGVTPPGGGLQQLVGDITYYVEEKVS